MCIDDNEEEDILMGKRGSNTVVEARFPPEERKKLAEAKREAVQVFVDSKAWFPTPAQGVDQAKYAPLRFLLPWKVSEDGVRTA